MKGAAASLDPSSGPSKKIGVARSFLLDIRRAIGYKKRCGVPVGFMRSSSELNSPKGAALAAAASRERQILDRLSAGYSRHVHELLRHRESIKGSVYEIHTRCGNASCHCAKPGGVRHPATVLSWSEAGKTRIRSLPPPDRARIRGLTKNYRHLRQSRAALVKLHKQVLAAVDRLEQGLRLPPPSPGRRNTGR